MWQEPGYVAGLLTERSFCFSFLTLVHCFSLSSEVWCMGWRIWERSKTAQRVTIIWCHHHTSTSTGSREGRRENVQVSTECANIVNRRASFGCKLPYAYTWSNAACIQTHHYTWSFPLTGSKVEDTQWDTIWVVHLQSGCRILVLCAQMVCAWDWYLVQTSLPLKS